MKPAFALLAAGASRRMGRPKQLLPWAGRPLLERSLRRLQEVAGGAPVLLILGAGREAIEAVIEPGEAIIGYNERWQEGLSSSIRCALQLTDSLPEAPDALLIALADQPAIEAQHFRALLNALDPPQTRLAASFYHGRPGAPAAFHRSLFPDLHRLTGDQGAKELFRKYAAQTRTIECPAAALDLDTPGDWRHFLKNFEE